MTDWSILKAKAKRATKTALSAIEEVAEVLPHITGKPSVYQLGALGLRGMRMFEKMRGKTGFDFGKLFRLPHGIQGLFRICKAHGKVTVLEERDEGGVVEILVGDVCTYWDVDGRDSAEGPFVDDVDAAYVAIGRMLWEHFGSRIRVDPLENGSYSYRLSSDDNTTVLTSEMAEWLTARVQMFREAGFSRAIILNGPPGTGKSCCARAVASQVGGMSLRVPVSKMDISIAVDLSRILRPDFMIIEDIDRSEMENSLDDVERLRLYVRVVIATTNNHRCLPDAMLRPGRFDEVYRISNPDPEVLKVMLEGVPKGPARKKAETLPAAFISEFVRRAKVLGVKVAASELMVLAERADSGFRRTARRKRKVRKNKRAAKPVADIASSAEVNDTAESTSNDRVALVKES